MSKLLLKFKNTSEGQHVFIKKPRNTTVKQNTLPKNVKSMRENGSCKVTDQMCKCK